MSFAIDDLASVLSHWSADQIGGLVDGDPVPTLPDSVAGWNLVGTTTTRPLYRPTSSIASLPAIEFDGTDDYLLSASRVLSGVNAPAVAIVCRVGTLKNYNSLLAITTSAASPANGAATTRLTSRVYSTGNLLSAWSNGSLSGNFTAVGPVAVTTNYLIRFSYADISRVVAVNGLAYSTGTGANSNAGSVINTTVYAHFGRENLAGAFFGGLVAEIVLWDETLLCESMYIEGELAHKYGLTLPTTHPFYAAAPTTGPSSGGSSGVSQLINGGLVRGQVI